MAAVERIKVWIYKGSQRAETYLYVPGEGDFERVPDPLLQAMGRLELVMDLELHAERPLARARVEEVMKRVAEDGFYLQMPPLESVKIKQ
ncbi:MAG: YcgL domain-containing protein [Gammaproteobacteria bacterium]|nr:YcgL domain-containing protein [Gammaproteobacteria bacterium]